MRQLYLGLFAAMVLAGCSSTPTQDAAPVDELAPGAATTAPAGGATTAGMSTSGITGTAAGAGSAPGATGALVPSKDAKGPLSQRVVQFDYDSFVVKDEYRTLVEAHARFLQANRSAKVTLHGHTDERGTREYNIALGQRRADAVKRMMVLVGAGEVQIETVSFGEEKPKSPGSHEEAWAENRRVEIMYVGE
jgi:peptidoglycan-associated lipoprotein